MNPRTLVALGLLTMLAAAPSFAGEQDCADVATATTNVDRLDGDIERLRDERKAKEADTQGQINAASRALIASGAWTEDDRASFFKKLVKSGDFKDLEKQKAQELKLFGAAAETMTTRRGEGNYPLACVSANEMRSRLLTLGTINDKQYELMLAKIQTVSSKKP